MGSLLSLLNLHRNATLKYDIFVDFENARPTESEQDVYIMVEGVLFDAADILQDLQMYKGASAEIRQAIANPHNHELQMKAWNTVVPLVCRLKIFFEFSIRLEEVVHLLLSELCSERMTSLKHLETQQALVKQFADILDFVLKFDDAKMLNPSIQNDFSYYRRTISRLRTGPGPWGADAAGRLRRPARPLRGDGQPHAYVSSSMSQEVTAETLGTMAKVCQRMIENQDFVARFQHEGTVLFVLRVMVGVIILYDHVHPVGAFSKAAAAHIDVRGSIKVLKEQPPTVVEGLLNALRYTTRTLNEETTPKSIKSLLAA
ncbi:Protein fam49b [Tyrophagus putrescentiae]|nr:Protein fam49b [Tyrophagus putrescentiae]